MRMGILAAVAVAVAACSDLPPYEPSCGNGVIELHEDCDSGPGCFSCARACDGSGGCPNGLACGADAVCHAPGGQFRSQGEMQPFDGVDLFVADVDHDRVGDLVEVTPTSLITLHGQLGIGPGAESVLQTPFITGRPAIGPFDTSDGTNDVVLPTVNGLVAYTSTQHTLSPYPFALDVSLPDPMQRARPWLVFPIDTTHLGLVTKLEDLASGGIPIPSTRRLSFATIDIGAGRPMFSTPLTICSALDPDGVVDTQVRRLDATHLMVALTGTTEGCVFRIDGYVAQAPVELATTDHVVLASLVNNPCPSALAGTSEYKPTGGFPTCGISTTATPLSQLAGVVDPSDVVVGTVPLVPPVSGDGGDALVTTHAIFAVSSTTATPVYRSDRALAHVESLDIDGDGDTDAVAIADGQTDLDVLVRFTPATGSQFQLIRYDTVAQPRKMLAGDFDGNQVTDLAYSEVTTYGERLLVLYGTHDRPLPPVEMATFKDLVSLLPGNRNQGDPSGTLEDLSVLDYDDATYRPLLTLMHGSPQRVLFPSFEPDLASVQAGAPPPPFVFVASGDLGGSGGVKDLLAIEAKGTHRVLYGALADRGAFGLDVQAFADIDCATRPDAIVCSNHLQYTTFPRGLGDSFFVVDDRHHAIAGFAPSLADAMAQDALFTDVAVPADLVVHSLQHLDLDGDGNEEIIASFGADVSQRAVSTTAMVVACHLHGDQVIVGSCAKLDDLISDEDGPVACVDSVVAQVTPTELALGTPDSAPPKSLLLLCHRPTPGRSDVFALTHDAKGFHTRRVLRITSTSVERLYTGDLDGDAIDDLITLDVAPGALVPQLTIYRQCTTRDTDTDCTRAP